MKIHLTLVCLVLLLTATSKLLNAQQTNLNVSRGEHEIDSIFNNLVKAAESLDAKKLASGVDDRYHAGFISNNIYYSDFNNLLETFKFNSKSIENQRIVIKEKKITVLPENVAILIATGEATAKTLSGTSFTTPFFWSFVFEKIGNDWKVIHSHQSVKK